MDVSKKEIDKLVSKGMPNNYLNCSFRKKRRSQNFEFPSVKNSSPGQYLTSSNSSGVIRF